MSTSLMMKMLMNADPNEGNWVPRGNMRMDGTIYVADITAPQRPVLVVFNKRQGCWQYMNGNNVNSAGWNSIMRALPIVKDPSQP